MMRRPILLMILTGVLALGCSRGRHRAVHVAATPEALSSGIVQRLAETFSRQSEVPVEVTLLQPSEIETSDADVFVVFDSGPLQTAGRVQLESVFAADEYAIAGPRADPAHVKTAPSAHIALKAIFDEQRLFCSPIDVAALHGRERTLVPVAPTYAKYVQCRGDAHAVFDQAERRGAYTLTFRSTVDAAHSRHIRSLKAATPELRDPYTIVLARRNRKANKNAEWFVEWVMSFRGREIVQSFTAPDGRRLALPD